MLFTQCICVFPMVKWNTVISLYVLNRLVLAVETQCVLCEVGTGYFVCCFDGLQLTRAGLSQVASCWRLTGLIPGHCGDSWWSKWHCDCFCPSTSVCPCQSHSGNARHSFMHLTTVTIRSTNEQSLGTFKQSNALSDIGGALDWKVNVSFVRASGCELSRCKTCNFNVFRITRNCLSCRQSVLWGQQSEGGCNRTKM